MAESFYYNLREHINEVESQSKIDHIFVSLNSQNGVAFCEKAKRWYYFSKTDGVKAFSYYDIIGCSSLENSISELSITISKKYSNSVSNTMFKNILTLNKFSDDEAWTYLVKFVNNIKKQTDSNSKHEYEKLLTAFNGCDINEFVTIIFQQTKEFKEKYHYIFELLNSQSINGVKYCVWVENQILKLFPQWENAYLFDNYKNSYVLTEIPLKDIVCCKITGDFFNETIVTGGGGGGSSLKGAIVGGIIAGEAGAIIGSRKKNEPIKTTNVSHDTRRTVLTFKKENQLYSINFLFQNYTLLKEKIQLHNLTQSPWLQQDTTKSDSVFQQLREFKILLDEGVITEEDYKRKKSQLLNM